AGGGLNHFLDVSSANEIAVWIRLFKRTAVAVSIMGMNDSAHPLVQAPGVVRGKAHRERGTAAVAVAERHDLVASGISSGQQNGSFVSLGAAIGEEALLKPPGCDGCQFLSQIYLR